MLSRPHRLPSSDIPTVMKRGKRVIGEGMTLFYLNTRQQPPRFTFLVSTKVSKKATERNRVRRLLSESTRHLLPILTVSIDGIIIGTHQLIELTQRDTEKRILAMLTNAKLNPS